jgi:hypothetical protein
MNAIRTALLLVAVVRCKAETATEGDRLPFQSNGLGLLQGLLMRLARRRDASRPRAIAIPGLRLH